MSLELKVAKKKLHFQLGQLVVPVEEPDAKPYCISGFLPTGAYEDHGADYVAVQITRRGKFKNRTFKQKDLKPYKK
jgi:hypothetical protein